MFNRVSKRTDDIHIEFHLARFHIRGDFNIHHKVWLVHTNKTDEEVIYWRDFSIAYDLTQFIKKWTLTPLKNAPQNFNTPLETSDHSFVSIKVDAKSKAHIDKPFHRTSFRYMKTDRWIQIQHGGCSSFQTQFSRSNLSYIFASLPFHIAHGLVLLLYI